jgi:hypothetical protein
LRVGALVVVVIRRRVVVVAGLGRRVVVVALTVVVGSGSVVVGGSVVVVVLAGTMEVTIEVTVTVRGSCSAPAPPAAAPATNPITPQMRPAAQARRHHGSWLGWRGGLGGGGAPQPPGGPGGEGGWPQPPVGGIGSVGRSPIVPLSLVVERGDSMMPTIGVKASISADALEPAESSRTVRPSGGSKAMFRQWVPSPVEVAAPARAVGLWPELSLQLHQAPDLGAVRATIGLDAFGEFVDGGQVDAEQLRASLQRRCDRLAHVQVVPSPHRASISNTSSRVDRDRCVARRGRAEPWVGRAGAATRRHLGDSRGQ